MVKVSVSEGRRPEEESSFWKISAERSRLEGEQADFQSLTPSQIKSLEKGEKSLPSYLRQVSVELCQQMFVCIFWPERHISGPDVFFLVVLPLLILPLFFPAPVFCRRRLSPPRSQRQQTPTLQLPPGPPSSERPNLLPHTPLPPPLSVQHQHPSPFPPTRPHLSACPPRLQAGSALRAPCRQSATPWTKCSPPA